MDELNDVAPLDPRDRWAASLATAGSSPPSMRIFGLVMFAGFGVLGALAVWGAMRNGSVVRRSVGEVMIAVGTLILLGTLVAPERMRPVHRGWMAFGERIGTVMSTLLLAVFYYVIVTPIGALMRLSGTDPIGRRWQPELSSYWTKRTMPWARDHYEHMS